MSNTQHTGGSAFPVDYFYDQDTGKEILPNEGMTLHDYFAAKAMQAIIGSDRYVGLIGVNNYEHRCAADAYKMADAMLEARATGGAA